MFSFRHFAAPAVVGIGLMFGAVGCSHDRDMPADARMISSGKEDVTVAAPSDGTVYVWDDTKNKEVYVGRVHKDDTIRVDAKHDKVLLNNQEAVKRELWDDHRYEVFFQPDNRSASLNGDNATVVRHADGTTVIQNGDKKTTVITPNSNTTSGDTVIRSDGTVVQPNGTTVQPNGTTVQPNGDRTVIKKETTIEQR